MPTGRDAPPNLLPVSVFTGSYCAAATAVSLHSGNREFVFYLAVMGVLVAGVFLVHRGVSRLEGCNGLPAGVLWALSVWGLLHMAGGLVQVPQDWPREGQGSVLYNLWLVPGRLKFDQAVHAYGFGVTTVVCWCVVRAVLVANRGAGAPPPEPTLGLLVLCAAAGMGFGALNEVIEFAATLLMEETNVGGYVNTGWDLVANLAGAALAAAGIRWFDRPERSTTDTRSIP